MDYHFGNGTASIFWDDPDVFFASVHADTEGDYPWCGGRASDAGGGRGQGKTLCEPLPRGATWDAEAIRQYAVDHFGVAAVAKAYDRVYQQVLHA